MMHVFLFVIFLGTTGNVVQIGDFSTHEMCSAALVTLTTTNKMVEGSNVRFACSDYGTPAKEIKNVRP